MYLSRSDLRKLKAEAMAGKTLTPIHVLGLLEEIDRLNSYIADMQADLDRRTLVARISDRRSEPRMAQTVENLADFTISMATTKKEGA